VPGGRFDQRRDTGVVESGQLQPSHAAASVEVGERLHHGWERDTSMSR
jgi:hypothetical protein